MQPLDARRCFISWWLAHIYFFAVFEFPIEVCAVKVESVDLPVVPSSHSQEKADASKSCNRRVCVIVIYAVDLSKTTSYKMCLVFLDRAVCFPLDTVNPFFSHNLLMCRLWDVTPCASAIKSGDLCNHGLLPAWPIVACLSLGK